LEKKSNIPPDFFSLCPTAVLLVDGKGPETGPRPAPAMVEGLEEAEETGDFDSTAAVAALTALG
jgi:hypothetical protein